MTATWRWHVIAVTACAAMCLARSAHADLRAITIDGAGDDWAELAPLAIDPTGDAPAGSVDFARVWAAHDGDALFLRFEVGRETIFPSTSPAFAGHNTAVYLDGDDNASTGSAIGGLGAELAVRFGARSATLYGAGGGGTSLSLNEAGVTYGPTYSADVFEVRIPFAVRPEFGAPVAWRTAPTIRLFLQDTATLERLPDTGSLTYAIDPGSVPAAEPIALDRAAPGDVRIVAQNVLNTSPADDPAPFGRILRALQPDLVAWQEVYPGDWNDGQILAFFAAEYPVPGGGTWRLARQSDCIVVSRWPILASTGLNGNVICLVDLPDDVTTHNLVLVSAHTPCCDSGNTGRDTEHDQIAATWRNLLAGTGPFPIAPDDALVLAGDFNMVGYARQLHSLRDGDIQNNAAWGPDFAPGRAAGPLAVSPLRHTHARHTFTWNNPFSSFAAGRLDYFFYTDDVMEAPTTFTLDTAILPPDVLAVHGLFAGDTAAASDHLPLVLDLRFAPPAAGLATQWRVY